MIINSRNLFLASREKVRNQEVRKSQKKLNSQLSDDSKEAETSGSQLKTSAKIRTNDITVKINVSVTKSTLSDTRPALEDVSSERKAYANNPMVNSVMQKTAGFSAKG